MRRFSLMVALAGILFAAFMTGAWIKEQFAIDDCLDEGGMWDYRRHMCVVRPLF